MYSERLLVDVAIPYLFGSLRLHACKLRSKEMSYGRLWLMVPGLGQIELVEAIAGNDTRNDGKRI